MATGDIVVQGNLIVPPASTSGVKIMAAAGAPGTSAYGWADIIGAIRPDPAGVNSPTLTTYNGAVRDYAYAAGDKMEMLFHMPHDYALGTDLYLHLHWSHIGTVISGSLVVSIASVYAKGHNQSNFGSVVTSTITVSTPDIATVPQYRHRVDEVQLSSSSPSGTLHDTALLEPDGVFLMSLSVTTIPTITTPATDPFLHTLDIHYQTTGFAGTKNRAPGFYT